MDNKHTFSMGRYSMRLKTGTIKKYLAAVIYLLVITFLFGGYGTANAQELASNLSFAQPNETTEAQKQQVSVHFYGEPLSNALRLIADKVNAGLAYRTEDIPTKMVTYQAEKTSVYKVLDGVLKGTGLYYSLSENRKVILIKKREVPKEVVRQETITGTVTDASTGEPLIGVNILVVGSSTGTTTNVDGHYLLQVESLQDTLRFSFIGYQSKTVAIDGRTTINVSLQPQTITGQELVVTGYRQITKGEVIGSVASIEGEEISAPTASVGRSLQGKVPGLVISDRGGEPGTSNLNILVRGKATLGNNSPLIIIDGVPRQMSDLANLASRDIANLSVLKDAAAAIYGARAANGVIVVQTKRGTKGATEITINASTGLSTFTRIPDLMSSYQLAKYKNEMQERYGRQLSYTQKDLELFKNGNAPITHPNTDWYDASLRNYAPQSHFNVAVSGGTDKVQYYLSGDYTHKESMYTGGDMYFNRYQIRSNIDAQVSEYLNVGLSLTGRLGWVHQPVKSAGAIFHLVQLTVPMAVARYPNGLPGYAAIGFNPVIGVTDKAGWDDTKRKTFRSKISFDFDLSWLTEGLSLEGVASFDYDVNNWKLFKNTWNLYQYDVETEEYIELLGKFSESQTYTSLNQANSVNKQQFYNISLRYNKNWGNHHISGFIAYEIQESDSSGLNGYRKYLVSDQKIYMFAASTLGQTTGGTGTASGRISYFGSISYDYKGKYLLNFTLRRDGSFNFPEGNRFGTFPSVSVGWRISDEPFMDATNNWLDGLKLRSSYGIMGNDRVPPFQYITKYSLTTGGGYYIFGESPQRYNGFYQSNIPNPNITWETAKKWNIGFDAILFNDKLNLSFDYFYNRRRDILITRNASVPEYTGLSLPDENLGKVNNSGIEIQVNYQNNLGEFSYYIGSNFSYHHNEIVYMDEAKDIPTYREKEGHPIDSWLVYKTDGIFNTQEEINNTEATLEGTKPGDIKYVDLNGDGEISGADRYRRHTSPIPKIQYGIRLGTHYKGFGLNVFFQGQAKAEAYIAHIRGAQSNLPEYLFTKRWTPDNKDATYPRAYDRNDFYNYSHRSDFWLYDASFIRLKSLTLSYNLPVNWISDLGLNNVQVYLKGYNLLTWNAMSDRTGGTYYDPEMVSEEGKYYPQQTIVTAGISINL